MTIANFGGVTAATLSRVELSKALTAYRVGKAAVIPARSSAPILECVRFDVTTDKVTICGTDLDCASRWEAILCNATTAMGAELAKHHNCIAGIATFELGFGGICVPINPADSETPFPDDWDHLDTGGREEWKCEQERLKAEALDGPDTAA